MMKSVLLNLAFGGGEAHWYGLFALNRALQVGGRCQC